MNFSEAVSVCFSKYATFTGRARRSEYWNFYLFTVIVNAVLSFIDAMLFGELGIEIFSTIFSFGVLIPTLAVGTRRLHDTNRSGWFQILPFVGIPFLVPGLFLLIDKGNQALAFGLLGIGGVLMLGAGIAVLIWLCTDSDARTNRFGVPPKEGIDSIDPDVESIFE